MGRNVGSAREKNGIYEGRFELKPNAMTSQNPLEDFGRHYIKVSTDDIPFIKVSTDDMPCVDPQAVNKLMSYELNELSLQHREQILEEIHGVKPGGGASLQHTNMQLTREEQEEDLFRQFHEELDRYYFSESATPGMDSFGNNSAGIEYKYPAYRYARENGSELIGDRTFQLTFFGQGEGGSCPKEAAKRMMNYLELVRQVYHTDDVLFRPITLSDLNEAMGSKEVMYQVAPIQILPLRDPSGRRVVVHLRDVGPASYPAIVRQQVGLYFAQTMCEDQDGLVFVYFMHHVHNSIFNPQEYKEFKKLIEVIPPRFSAVHLCFPAGQFYEIAKAAIMLLMGKENRKRLRLHVGSYQECKYALRSFGIPVSRLPIDLESKFKISKKKQFDLKYHRKWLSMREAKETAMFAAIGRDRRGRAVEPNKNDIGVSFKGVMTAVREFRSKFVECPRHEDCLFGKGRPAMYHPGNIAMRRLLEAKIERFEAMAPLQKSIVVWEVVNAISQGKGRFLKEDSDHAGVLVITDDDTAFKKIAIAFRDLKKRRIREGEQKDSGGRPMRRSSKQQLAEKKDLQTTRNQSATVDSQLSFISSGGRSSVSSSPGVHVSIDNSTSTSPGMNICMDTDLDIGNELHLCFFPPSQGDNDSPSKPRKAI